MGYELKERNGCITSWLWIVIIANIGLAIFYSVSMFLTESLDETIGYGICSILGTVNVLSAILLMRWNKAGFYMFVVSNIIALFVNLFMLNVGAQASISSLSGIVIWWAILQIKQNGVSAWSQLQSGWNGKNNRQLYLVFAVICVIQLILTTLAFRMMKGNSNDFFNDTEIVLAPDEDDQDLLALDASDVEVETVASKNVRFLQNLIEETNKEYPQKVEEGIHMIRVSLDDNYMVYQAECDEDVIDMDVLKMRQSNMKEAIKENLSPSDPEIKMLMNACIKAEKGLAYKYVGNTSGKTVYIRFSREELENW